MQRDHIIDTLSGKYDGIIFAQNHREFIDIDLSDFLVPAGVVFDLKGRFRNISFPWYKSL